MAAAGSLFVPAFLKYLPFAWLAIFLCASLLSFLFILLIKHRVFKLLFINSFFLFFILAGVEGGFYHSTSKSGKYEGDDPEQNYLMRHDLLGYAPIPNSTTTIKKSAASEVIYNVTYTIDDNGLRISPESNIVSSRCLLFFGGSFTFGEGVNDHEAMPYVVGELAPFRIYNFGVGGYGPHQMLAAIEHGIVTRAADCRPSAAIYQALPAHVARSAGYSSWDTHGPKYVLHGGRAQYAGRFDDDALTSNPILSKIYSQIKKSFIYQKFLGLNWHSTTKDDLKLFLEIVDTSAKRLAEMYQNVEFHVILWDLHDDGVPAEELWNGLNDRGIRVHLVSRILPELAGDPSRYELSKHDRHPNARAHREIAEYVARHITGTW